jgi:hypothetical protein
LLAPSDLPKWRRLASSLGQIVALQRLTLDQEAVGTISGAQSEASGMQEHEQNGEQQLVRDHNHFTQGQERDRRAWPKQEGQKASGRKRQQQESGASGTSAHTPARQPEGSSSSQAIDGRRRAGKQSSLGRTTEKHKAHALETIVPQHQTARRKPRAIPTARVASHRSARKS